MRLGFVTSRQGTRSVCMHAACILRVFCLCFAQVKRSIQQRACPSRGFMGSTMPRIWRFQARRRQDWNVWYAMHTTAQMLRKSVPRAILHVVYVMCHCTRDIVTFSSTQKRDGGRKSMHSKFGIRAGTQWQRPAQRIGARTSAAKSVWQLLRAPRDRYDERGLGARAKSMTFLSFNKALLLSALMCVPVCVSSCVLCA